jgi:signal transduction histidine kinase
VEAGQVELHEEDVQLEGVITDVEALVGPQMHARELVYSHARSHRALTVRADPERVRQIMLNLLTNAVKFTPRGGQVTLACAADVGSVRIMVSDSGRGIPAGELERIFEPFVQVDRHLTHGSQQGVGLGLSIARDLARRMGGDLTVRSTIGSGSVFTLTLPRPRAAAARAEA